MGGRGSGGSRGGGGVVQAEVVAVVEQANLLMPKPKIN